MGEEYGEPRPFQYFISHGDPPLIEGYAQAGTGVRGVPRRGRSTRPAGRGDFRGFQTAMDARKNVSAWTVTPLPRVAATAAEQPALAHLDNASLTATVIAPGVLELRRWCNAQRIAVWMNFAAESATVSVEPGVGAGANCLTPPIQPGVAMGLPCPRLWSMARSRRCHPPALRHRGLCRWRSRLNSPPTRPNR